MSSTATTSGRPRKLFTIQQQFLFALVGANMLVTIAVPTLFYQSRRRILLAGIDERLKTAAVMAREMLPADYHDKIGGPESVSDDDFQRTVDHNNRLCQELGLEYIWSLLLVDGRIVFTSSTSPDKAVQNRRHAAFFEAHSNPELYTNTFATMRATYKSNNDKWGDIRVALLPSLDAHGRKYLFGASVRLTDVERQLNDMVLQSLVAGLAVFAFSLLLGLWISRLVIAPLHQLTETIRVIAGGDTQLEADEGGSYEQVMLARHFNRLNRALQEKIAQLESSRTRLLDQRDAERRQAEEDLVVSEQRYRRLLNFAVDGILMGSREGVILDTNQCMCKIFGLPRHEIIGKHISAMPFTPESIKKNPWRYDLLQRGETVVSERTVRRRNGSEVVIEMHTKMMPDGTYQSIYHEITERKRAEEALLEAQRMLEESQRIAKLGAWKYDAVADTHVWSDEIYRIHGVGKEFRPGDLNAQLAFFPPASRAEIAIAFHRAVEAGEPYDLELEFVRATGEQIWVRASARPLVVDGRVTRIDGTLMDITERKRTQALLESWTTTLERRVAERTAEVEKYARQLQALTERLSRVEEDERRRIANVLHEDVQQTLAAVRMTLVVARDRVRGGAAKEAMDRADGMLEQSIRLTRTLVHDIAVPGLRERDLSFALSWLAQRMFEKFGLAVSVKVEDPVPAISENDYLCLYRAVQETLFNVVKHAGVRKASVAVRVEEAGFVRVTVADQGCGFMPAGGSTPRSGGFGLFNTRERIEGLGGFMIVESVAGQGTTVTLRVPLRA